MIIPNFYHKQFCVIGFIEKNMAIIIQKYSKITFMYIVSYIEDNNFIFFQGTTTILFYKDSQDEKKCFSQTNRPINTNNFLKKKSQYNVFKLCIQCIFLNYCVFQFIIIPVLILLNEKTWLLTPYWPLLISHMLVFLLHVKVYLYL